MTSKEIKNLTYGNHLMSSSEVVEFDHIETFEKTGETTEVGWVAVRRGDGHVVLRRTDELKPIRITPEIMIESGFECLRNDELDDLVPGAFIIKNSTGIGTRSIALTKGKTVWHNGRIEIWYGTGAYDYYRVCDCVYVHELENICKLMDITCNIKGI